MIKNQNFLEEFKNLSHFDRVRIGYLQKLPFNVAISVYFLAVYDLGFDPSKLAVGVAVVVYFATNIIKQELLDKNNEELKKAKPSKLEKKRA